MKVLFLHIRAARYFCICYTFYICVWQVAMNTGQVPVGWYPTPAVIVGCWYCSICSLLPWHILHNCNNTFLENDIRYTVMVQRLHDGQQSSPHSEFIMDQIIVGLSSLIILDIHAQNVKCEQTVANATLSCVYSLLPSLRTKLHYTNKCWTTSPYVVLLSMHIYN